MVQQQEISLPLILSFLFFIVVRSSFSTIRCVDHIKSSTHDLTSPSLTAILNVVESLERRSDPKLDGLIASQFEGIDLFGYSGRDAPTTDFWNTLFYDCRVTNDDSLVTIIYKLGLFAAAKKLIDKRLVDNSRLSMARSRDGKNVMHHAVASRNPALVGLLANTLQERVLLLLLAKDRAGDTPVALTRKPGYDGVGVIDKINTIYRTYEGAQFPAVPLALLETKFQEHGRKKIKTNKQQVL